MITAAQITEAHTLDVLDVATNLADLRDQLTATEHRERVAVDRAWKEGEAAQELRQRIQAAERRLMELTGAQRA